MKRKIVKIDREKCNGCGLCIDACHEGAIQLVGGKAELVSDIYCDGLGDCLGECPRDAITIEEREADAYDEAAVQKRLLEVGMPSESVGGRIAGSTGTSPAVARGGCPGMRKMSWGEDAPAVKPEAQRKAGMLPANGGRGRPCSSTPSALRQWPVQLKLVPVNAPYWEGADILLSADCVAHAYGGFHQELLAGRRLIVACPKLDHSTEEYVEKLAAILETNSVKSLTVAYMEVPCCQGIVRIAEEAIQASGREVPVEKIEIGIEGQRQ
jgi:NAD-dependent dihydropyrimidine dehydrogenase PreA subunit